VTVAVGETTTTIVTTVKRVIKKVNKELK